MELGERPDTPRPTCLPFGHGELRGGVGRAVSRNKKTDFSLRPVPLLHSVKQQEALFVLSLGPVSLLKMKTKFPFEKKGARLKATDHILSALGVSISGKQHNKRSHLASCVRTESDAGVIPLVIAAASK